MKKILAMSLLSVFLLGGCGVEDEMYVPTEEDVKNFHKSNQDTLCTAEPFTDAIGNNIYPIANEYINLNFLGQIFTAADCGKERLEKVFSGNYYWGLGINLISFPGTELLKTLKLIGFSCYTDDPDKSCLRWQLEVDVSDAKIALENQDKMDRDIQKILQLKPFYKDFSFSGCLNCG